jgi:hypothetical protein
VSLKLMNLKLHPTCPILPNPALLRKSQSAQPHA